MGLLRHGGMHRIFGGVRAWCGPPPPAEHSCVPSPSARAAAAGGVEAVVGQPDGHAPLLVGTDQISFVDIDDTMKAIYGYAKQGAGYGYNGVKELNALFGTVTTPTGAPVPLTRPVPE